MDFGLSDEQKMILGCARVRAQGGRAAVDGGPKAEIARRAFSRSTDAIASCSSSARTAGLWGLQTPEEYGGANLGSVHDARSSHGARPDLRAVQLRRQRRQHPVRRHRRAEAALPAADDRGRAALLLRDLRAGHRLGRDATSRPARSRTAATGCINGEKMFISSGNEADFAIVFAVTDKEKGARRHHRVPGRPRHGLDRSPIPLMGSWGPAALCSTTCACPTRTCSARWARASSWPCSGSAAAGCMIPARAVGRPSACCEMGVDYARQRQAMGQPIADYQAIQWMLADSARSRSSRSSG